MKTVIAQQSITTNHTSDWFDRDGLVITTDAHGETFSDFLVLCNWSGATGTLDATIELWGKVGGFTFKIGEITANASDTSADAVGFNVIDKLTNAIQVKVIINNCTQLTNFQASVDIDN